MRILRLTVVVGAVILGGGVGHAADPAKSGVDIGSKTSGIGTDRAPQPSPYPSVAAHPNALPSGSGVADTPGKTGLGYPHDDVSQPPGSVPGAPPPVVPSPRR